MSTGIRKKKKKPLNFHRGGSSAQGQPAQLPKSSIADETVATVVDSENRVQTGKSKGKSTQVHESSSIDVTLGSKDTIPDDGEDLVGKYTARSNEEQAESKHARKVFDEMTHPDSVKENENKGDWASLFKNNRNNSQGIKLGKLDGDLGSEVLIDDEDLQDVSKVLGSTLIGYVAGKSTGKLAIVQCCNKWKEKEQVIFHRSGWWLFDSLAKRTEIESWRKALTMCSKGLFCLNPYQNCLTSATAKSDKSQFGFSSRTSLLICGLAKH